MRLVTEWALGASEQLEEDWARARADEPSKGLRDPMTTEYPMVDVVKVKPMEAFRLWVQFSDGSEGVADLSGLAARTGPMAAPLKDAFFSRVFVEAGVPTWPNGYDYAPSALYAEMREAGALANPSPKGRGAGERGPGGEG